MPSPRAALSKLPIVIRLVGGLLVLVLLGTLALMHPAMGGTRALRFDEAIFTAISALAVTGLTTNNPAIDLSRAGQGTVLVLVQVGGVGYMALAVAIFQLLGRRLTLTDRLALTDSLGLLTVGGVTQLLRRILLGVLAIEAIGALALFVHWQGSQIPPSDRAFFAVFYSITAFCNAGFDIAAGVVPGGQPNDPGTLAILGILIVLGGLGAPVLFDLFAYRRRRVLALHTRISLVLTLALITFGTLGIWLGETSSRGVLFGLPPDRQIGLSLFQAVACRTAGFYGLPDFPNVGPAAQLIMVLLMFIGTGSASMGGGITTGTFAVLLLALRAYVRGQDTPLIAGRAIPGNLVRKAAAVLTIALSLVTAATWVILLTHETTLQVALFEVVSAFATCGVSLGFTPQLNPVGQTVIMLMMFWGRLGALTVLYLFARTTPSRLRYPEEKLLIG